MGAEKNLIRCRATLTHSCVRLFLPIPRGVHGGNVHLTTLRLHCSGQPASGTNARVTEGWLCLHTRRLTRRHLIVSQGGDAQACIGAVIDLCVNNAPELPEEAGFCDICFTAYASGKITPECERWFENFYLAVSDRCDVFDRLQERRFQIVTRFPGFFCALVAALKRTGLLRLPVRGAARHHLQRIAVRRCSDGVLGPGRQLHHDAHQHYRPLPPLGQAR